MGSISQVNPMRILLFLFLFIFFPRPSKAQEVNSFDSLKSELNLTSNSNTKLKLYLLILDQKDFQFRPEFKTITQDGIALAKVLKDTFHVAKMTESLAKLYNFEGKKDSAALLLYRAASLFEKNNHELEAAGIYNEIGRMYRKEDLNRAVSFYDKAYAIYEKNNDEKGKAIILNESGVAYESSGNLEEAKKRYNSSLEIAQKLNDKTSMSYSYEFLGSVALRENEINTSKHYLSLALSIRQSLQDTFALAITYTNFGEFYQHINEIDHAIESVIKSNLLAKQINYLNLIAYNYNLLSGLYQSKQNYKAALENLNLHVKLKDSIDNIEKAKQIEEISVRYETEKNKNLIKEQEFSLLKQRYMLAFSIFAILAIVGISFSIFKRVKLKNKTKLQETVIREQALSAQAVMNAEEEERKRIASDLHDGVGQLMSAAKMNLSVLEFNNDFRITDQQEHFQKALDLVDESCIEIRNVSHNLMPNSLLNNSLPEAVQGFLNKLSKTELQIHFYHEGFTERLSLNTETVLYRIMQESVNNAMKHAEAKRLDISLIKEKDEINITIEDDGKGFDMQQMNQFEGIGLKNMASRITFLKGTLEFDAHLGKGTLISINLPIQNNN